MNNFRLRAMTMMLAAAVCLAVPAAASPARDVAAEELMARVRAAIPEVPLEMSAQIRVLDRNGRAKDTVQAEALLTPTPSGRSVRYTLLDAFGGTSERMTVDLSGNVQSFAFETGEPPSPAATPDLFAPVAGSDICWMELSFSFFFWPGARMVGEEKVMNRWNAQIIELECPPDFRARGGWSHIRLWVVPAYAAVVKGEAWRDGKAVKRLEVQSVRRLRKVYMIGDMLVRNLETGTRSALKVRQMRMLSPEYSEEELREFNAPVEW